MGNCAIPAWGGDVCGEDGLVVVFGFSHLLCFPHCIIWTVVIWKRTTMENLFFLGFALNAFLPFLPRYFLPLLREEARRWDRSWKVYGCINIV
jgi:hypothetical protein